MEAFADVAAKPRRPKESAAHRRARKLRADDRMLLRVQAARDRLHAHHGSTPPRVPQADHSVGDLAGVQQLQMQMVLQMQQFQGTLQLLCSQVLKLQFDVADQVEPHIEPNIPEYIPSAGTWEPVGPPGQSVFPNAAASASFQGPIGDSQNSTEAVLTDRDSYLQKLREKIKQLIVARDNTLARPEPDPDKLDKVHKAISALTDKFLEGGGHISHLPTLFDERTQRFLTSV